MRNFHKGKPKSNAVYCNCFPGSDIINFEINFIFQIKLFSYMAKQLKTKNSQRPQGPMTNRWTKNNMDFK